MPRRIPMTCGGHRAAFASIRNMDPDLQKPASEVFMPQKRAHRKYGAKAGAKVKRAMHEMKRGELKSGRSGKKVSSRKQAIAIGLSEARRAGAKVPRKKAS